MEGKGVLIAALFLSMNASAQFTTSRQVTFRAHATVAPGFMVGSRRGVLNLVGDAEYFLSNLASLRFDGSYYLLPLSNEVFEMNHGVYVGMCFRPTLRNFAPFVGFQPGVHITKLAPIESAEQPIQIVPVISGIAGFNWYFIDFLHISAGARVLHGNAFETKSNLGNHAVSLTEMRAWLGLGFQITTKRRKFDD